MEKYKLQDSFKEFCNKNKFEINDKQVEIINLLHNFINSEKNFLNYFLKPKKKMCFYLYGNVGVGKTMLLNFAYNKLNIKKCRLHFNEFMINFHDFRHATDDENIIISFVKNLKKNYELLYLDEFQVTNIVDAMILGKLFEVIFSENIKIILTTNIALNDLYKDGLQREKFLPFISIIKKNSIQKELSIFEDFRLHSNDQLYRIFYPLNEKIIFKINKTFRELTKDKQKEKKIIITKGRSFKINNFYEGITRFKFKDLCEVNFGGEDYINLAEICNHIFIENIPTFTENNSNQQLRFITLIDILYEKKISLSISVEKNLKKLDSSKKHSKVFKRTLSRLYEMTKIN